MQMGGFVVFFVCLLRSGAVSLNDYDNELHYNCPREYQAISHVNSIHNDRKEDRIFSLACSDVIDGVTTPKTSCYSTGTSSFTFHTTICMINKTMLLWQALTSYLRWKFATSFVCKLKSSRCLVVWFVSKLVCPSKRYGSLCPELLPQFRKKKSNCVYALSGLPQKYMINFVDGP